MFKSLLHYYRWDIYVKKYFMCTLEKLGRNIFYYINNNSRPILELDSTVLDVIKEE